MHIFQKFFFSKYFLADNLTNEKKLIIIFIVKFRFSAKCDISRCEKDTKKNLNEVVIKFKKRQLKNQ